MYFVLKNIKDKKRTNYYTNITLYNSNSDDFFLDEFNGFDLHIYILKNDEKDESNHYSKNNEKMLCIIKTLNEIFN